MNGESLVVEEVSVYVKEGEGGCFELRSIQAFLLLVRRGTTLPVILLVAPKPTLPSLICYQESRR
jgi:hypothetical protein